MDIKTSENADIKSLTQAQRNRRHVARLLAEFPDFVRQEIQDGLAKDPPRVSPSKLIKQCQRRRSLRDVPMSERRYSILLADPPWRYDAAEAGIRQIENQYGTMSLEAAAALIVASAPLARLRLLGITTVSCEPLCAILRAWLA